MARLVLASSAVALGALIAVTRASGRAPPSWVAAVLGALAALAAVVALALAIRRLRAGTGPAAENASEAIAMAGLLVLFVAGLSNWLLEYRGLLLMEEGDEVVLGPEAHLREVAVGPLGRLASPAGTLRLEHVRLVSTGGGFLAESDLGYTGVRGEAQSITVRSALPARVGPVLAYQGAFGFVARVVVQHRGHTLFDRFVPLESRVDARRAIAFEDTLDVGQGGVRLVVAVSLEHLDETMKGHPVLGVELRRGDEILGAGELLPGHGATMRDGWHVGFGGMRRWSEIDLARGNFRGTALAGVAVTLAGAAGLAVARRRRR